MAKSSAPAKSTSLILATDISNEVLGWRNQGYHPFPSETTRQLLSHWFDRDDDADAKFHECQRVAIETIIYLHEIRQIQSLRALYDAFAPDKLKLFKTIADEVAETPFLKYCIKSATGSGKTWVLAALVVWQYFNSINGETNAAYSPRFMVVNPGLEVRNRILDSFLGRRGSEDRQPASRNQRLSQTAFYPRQHGLARAVCPARQHSSAGRHSLKRVSAGCAIRRHHQLAAVHNAQGQAFAG